MASLHLYVESKENELRETETRLVVATGGGRMGEMGEWSKGTNFQL